MLNGTVGEIETLSGGALQVPDGLDRKIPLQIHGGGTMIFDEFGRARHHLAKPIFDWPRQTRRLEYLVRNRLTDTNGRFGFSPGIAEGQRFAVLHDPGVDRE